MITRPQHDVSEIQAGADRSDPAYTYYLNPISVVNKNLPQYGFRDPFQIVSPTRANPTPTPYTGQDGRPVVKAVVRYDNQLYTIQVAQPGVQGPKGIWVIVTIFPPGSA